MIQKFDDFTSGINPDRVLLYYAFDWDDNILSMPTEIIVQTEGGEEIGMSTSDFAIYREKLNSGEVIDYKNHKVVSIAKNAFRNFGDLHGEGNKFLEDVKIAIDGRRFAPSWNDFKECLSNGALFAIITARGHESKTIREGVEYIIDNVLTSDEVFNMYNNCLRFSYLLDQNELSKRLPSNKPSTDPVIKEYLNHCDFVGVSAPSRGGSPANPEKAKEDALMSFIDKVDNFVEEIKERTNDSTWSAMIGFSDDDLKNVKHIEDLIDTLHHERFSNISKVIVKGTKNPESITKKQRLFLSDKKLPGELTETSHQTPGLESSVLKFTQFGNMTGHLYPEGPDRRQDDGFNAFKRATNQLSKMSKEIIGKKKIKKKKSSS